MEREGTHQELKKGPWKPEEDLLLKRYIETHGEGKWATVSKRSGLMRGGKSCRLRWKNYLRPNLKRGEISQEEEDLIIRMHKLLGNRWSLIAGRLPGRTDNEVKNYWNTHLTKRNHQGKTVGSNSKRRKHSHLPDAQPSCGDSPHNTINGSDEGSDVQTVPSPCMDDTNSYHYNVQTRWLPTDGTFYEEPFLPSLDSIFLLEEFEQRDNKSGIESLIYLPDDMYPVLI